MKPFAPLLLSAALALGATASSADASKVPSAADIPPAPVARVEPVTDTYFGETLVDRYRWMENTKDPDWLPYMTGQGAHARAVLEALPGRATLLARIQKLSGDSAATSEFRRAGHRLFYQQRPTGANNYKLFVRDGNLRRGRDRLLVDPTTLDTPGHHVSLDWWSASPDGRRLVYGLSSDGSEDSTLHILNVDTGVQLPERIANTEDASPSWLPDASGFFYNQLTGDVGTPERYLDSKLRFHRLGTDAATDPVLMARGLDPAVAYDRIQMPSIVVPPGSDRAVLVLADVRSERRLFIAPLADAVASKARWQPVADFSDEVTDFALVGDALYLLAAKGHPRGRVLLTSASVPDIATAREAVPESNLVLEEIIRTKDGLYLRAMDGGLGRLERMDINSGTYRVHSVPVPYDGTLRQVEGTPDERGVLVQMTGWLKPAGVLSFDGNGHTLDINLTPRPAIDTRPYLSERRFATAKDGTRIPYDLIYRKGLKRDGQAPTFLSAYGSYGSTPYTPAFNARTLALVDQGAIVGYADVRGGGEYGREWHRAGQLENKPNTWRDLIAVSEDMIAQGYTAPAHLAIGGRSAGGITMGRALTERPDLFAAVVSGVGWHDPLRYVVEQDGYGEEPEWGAISVPAGYRALKAIDSYQAVTDGTKYPAVLLTTGLSDPRVAPFHVAKMAARLQAATGSDKPILMRVDVDAGHGIGSTRAQADAEAADTYAFILWQTTGAAAAH